MAKNLELRKDYIAPGVFIAVFISVIGGWLWWSSRQFEHAADHWLAEASQEARAWADDAELRAIEGHYVRPDGVAELPNEGDSGWSFAFRSPSLANGASPPAPKAIPGAPPPPSTRPYACFLFTVSRGSGRGGNLLRTRGNPVLCNPELEQASSAGLRCSVREIWARAEELGAPNPGLATVEAKLLDGGWHWSFRIANHVEFELPDDC